MAFVSTVDTDTQPDPQPQRRSGGCAWPLAAVIIVMAALLAYFLHGGISMPGSVARDLRDSAAKLGNLFGTDVKVDSRSVTLESKEILELATVQHRVVCVTKYETKWAGSKATIIIRGVFTVKAGFTIDGQTTFRFDESGKVLDDTLPPAKILSVTTAEQQVFFDSQGVWKGLNASDYDEAFRQNRAQAMVEAEQLGMREQAKARLKERLGDILPGPAFKPLLP